MKRSLFAFIAIVSGLVGCGSNDESLVAHQGDDSQSPLGNDFELSGDWLTNCSFLTDKLRQPRNYSSSNLHLSAEEIAEAIARCAQVKLPDQTDDSPPEWESFDFNGRTYYYVTLASEPPSK